MTQHLNLYHPGLEPPGTRFSAVQGLAALGVTVLVLTAAGLAMQAAERSARADVKALNQAMEQQRAALSAMAASAGLPAAQMQELLALRQIDAGERRLRSVVDSGEAGAGAGFSEELIALGQQVNTSVWLTGIMLSRVDHSMELQGRTTDPSVLPVYLQNLQDQPSLKGRPFAQLQVRGEGTDGTGQPLPYADFALRSTSGPAAAGGNHGAAAGGPGNAAALLDTLVRRNAGAAPQ